MKRLKTTLKEKSSLKDDIESNLSKYSVVGVSDGRNSFQIKKSSNSNKYVAIDSFGDTTSIDISKGKYSIIPRGVR